MITVNMTIVILVTIMVLHSSTAPSWVLFVRQGASGASAARTLAPWFDFMVASDFKVVLHDSISRTSMGFHGIQLYFMMVNSVNRVS